MGRLKGQLALVTGASAGIGKATVDALVHAGATVLATGRRKAELDALVQKHGAQSVQTIAGDLNGRRLCRRARGAGRDAGIVVSDAGILTYAPLMDMTFDEYETIKTNVMAWFRVMQTVAESMIERKRGHVDRHHLDRGTRGLPARRGLLHDQACAFALARGMRIELQGFGIKVTEIAPGMVDTEIRATSNHPSVIAAVNARRFSALMAQEVADAVVYAAQATQIFALT